MSLKDIVSLPVVWISAGVTLIVATIGYFGNRAENKAKAEKTQAEKDEVRFKLKVEMDRFEEDKEARYDKKIADLSKRVDEQDFKINEQNTLILGLKKLISQYMQEIEELKAKNNLFNTINS